MKANRLNECFITHILLSWNTDAVECGCDGWNAYYVVQLYDKNSRRRAETSKSPLDAPPMHK